jgi:hypothetical protein
LRSDKKKQIDSFIQTFCYKELIMNRFVWMSVMQSMITNSGIRVGYYVEAIHFMAGTIGCLCSPQSVLGSYFDQEMDDPTTNKFAPFVATHGGFYLILAIICWTLAAMRSQIPTQFYTTVSGSCLLFYGNCIIQDVRLYQATVWLWSLQRWMISIVHVCGLIWHFSVYLVKSHSNAV